MGSVAYLNCVFTFAPSGNCRLSESFRFSGKVNIHAPKIHCKRGHSGNHPPINVNSQLAINFDHPLRRAASVHLAVCVVPCLALSRRAGLSSIHPWLAILPAVDDPLCYSWPNPWDLPSPLCRMRCLHAAGCRWERKIQQIVPY